MTTTEVPVEGLTISEAAEASGLTVDTLRYYEKAGLTLHRPGRSSSGQRRYSEENLRWLRTLVMLRRTGMPIRDVRRFVDLYRVDGSEADRLQILLAHRSTSCSSWPRCRRISRPSTTRSTTTPRR